MRARARGVRRRRHEPVRQPDPVRPRRGPRALPARRGARRSSSPSASGVDLVYAPDVEEIYPQGFATDVEVERPHRGALRRPGARAGPEHFRGVTTVVAKLFNSRPARRRLLRPEGRPAGGRDPAHGRATSTSRSEIEVLPTVREADGLALSSRNAYLDAEERERARGALAARCAPPSDGRGRRDSTRRGLAAPPARELASRRDRARVPGGARRRRPRAGAELNGRPVLIAVAARVGERPTDRQRRRSSPSED